MRARFVLAVPLVLSTTIALADPPRPADAVAAAVVSVADAKARGDVAALRAVLKLPLVTTWKANSGQGDCNVPQSKSVADPIQAATALGLDPRFVAVLRRDKGTSHRGGGCPEEGSATPFTHGDPAITVTGDSATVVYDQPACGAGIPSYTLTLHRDASGWKVVSYDSGCHY